jgi:hypothetical protein
MCAERERLLNIYFSAVQAYSAEFLHREHASITARSALLILERHMAEHGCGLVKSLSAQAQGPATDGG